MCFLVADQEVDVVGSVASRCGVGVRGEEREQEDRDEQGESHGSDTVPQPARNIPPQFTSATERALQPGPQRTPRNQP